MTYKEAKAKIGKYLWCWCNGGNDVDTIDGLVDAGIINENDRQVMFRAYRYYERLLEREISKNRSHET